MPLNDILIRLGTALLLGAAIGFERQWRNHYAGLRTNTLITIGSAGLMIFAQTMPGGDASASGRIAAQILTGIGFLCAGVIMHEGVNVKGLNTSVTLWCSACVGMFTGSGTFLPAGVLAAFIIGANLLLRPLVYYINSRTPVSDELEAHYSITVTCSNADINRLRAAMMKHMAWHVGNLKNLGTKFTAESAQINADFVFPMRVDMMLEKMVEHIATEPGIAAISWHIA